LGRFIFNISLKKLKIVNMNESKSGNFFELIHWHFKKNISIKIMGKKKKKRYISQRKKKKRTRIILVKKKRTRENIEKKENKKAH